MKLSRGTSITSRSSRKDGESQFLLTNMLTRKGTFLQNPGGKSKFTPDYKKMVKFIPESGLVQGQQEQRQYKYSWAETANRVLAVQDDFQTFGLGHPDFQKNSRLTQLKDSSPLLRRIDESLSQEHHGQTHLCQPHNGPNGWEDRQREDDIFS